jgi:hypothetical protein
MTTMTPPAASRAGKYLTFLLGIEQVLGDLRAAGLSL